MSNKTQINNQTIKDIKNSLKEMKQGKGESLEEVAKEFGVRL